MRGRTGLVALVLALVALGGVGWLVYGQVDARDAASTATTERDQAAGAAKSLADQVADACAKGGPAAAELGRACEQAAQVQATPAPAVARDGRDGRNGTDGKTPPCYFEASQCRGADGQNGTDGSNGQDGKNGTDGADGKDGQTPACMAEPDQCRGASGPGGPPGPPGPTCPDGYELRDAVITAPDGSTYTGKACVDPKTSAPPSTDQPQPHGGS
ncbi:hypothetical protein GCM10027258_57970 [Amycolatopsis stemonae]